MKNFAFRTRLSSLSKKNFYTLLCSCKSSLLTLFRVRSLGFLSLATPLRVVGSNGLLFHLVLGKPSGPRHLRHKSLRILVGSNGLGPSTSRLSGVCSNQLSYEPIFGGGNRVRTDDPLLAGQVLYQLSYTPIISLFREKKCST